MIGGLLLPSCLVFLVLARVISALPTNDQMVLSDGARRAGWVDPRLRGGRMLDFTTKRRGEPLNVIISGLSDPRILTEEGLKDYAKSIGFSNECLGIHRGNVHGADLGDGIGRRDEQYLSRQYYFHPIYGTCWESIAGGNHFRAWKQNGTEANTGAWFLAVSKEQYFGKNHEVAADGYNVGRDWLVERAELGGAWAGLYWKANVEWNTHLLPPGNDGINHRIPQDGRVAILTVTPLIS